MIFILTIFYYLYLIKSYIYLVEIIFQGALGLQLRGMEKWPIELVYIQYSFFNNIYVLNYSFNGSFTQWARPTHSTNHQANKP